MAVNPLASSSHFILPKEVTALANVTIAFDIITRPVPNPIRLKPPPPNAENNAILIGKNGKTLSAFNTILRGAVNSEFRKRIDVLVDVNNYKEDRYHRLASAAKRTAKQVQRSHVDASLDPMPNDERKVIHKTLNNWHNIRTESEGEGSDRHVVIKYVEDEA